MATYKLVWDDFCSWYLEAVKPEFSEGKALPVDKATYDASIAFLEDLLKLLHPFMPFLTEEIWHQIRERNETDCIVVAPWPQKPAANNKELHSFEHSKQIVINLRNIRSKHSISPKQRLLFYSDGDTAAVQHAIIEKLGNAKQEMSPKPSSGVQELFNVGGVNYYVPINTDTEKVRRELMKDLDYNKGFLKSVQAKLANEKFVANAKPEVIAIERKKETDALSKIKAIEQQLASL